MGLDMQWKSVMLSITHVSTYPSVVEYEFRKLEIF